MKNLVPIARTFYCIGVIGMALQQFYYAEFRPAIILKWPSWLPPEAWFADLSGFVMILLSLCIVLNKQPRTCALFLAVLFLFFFLFFQVPYMLFVYSDPSILGAWTNPLKTLALSGGAWVVADSFLPENTRAERILSPLIPCGKIFFSIMLIVFGIEHFVYTDFVATLVPSWIPLSVFWTYFAAVALIGSGIAILFNIKRRTIAMFTGFMLFIWFLILHIPRAIEYTDVLKGNELTSVFEALAFSGVAFLIALSAKESDSFYRMKNNILHEPIYSSK